MLIFTVRLNLHCLEGQDTGASLPLHPAHLTLARGPVLSKLSLAPGPSLEDFRTSEEDETLLKRTL